MKIIEVRKALFENAELGDKYMTRDGRTAALWYYHVGNSIIDEVVLITTDAKKIVVDGFGKHKYDCAEDDDIIGKFGDELTKGLIQERIDNLAATAEGYAIVNDQSKRQFFLGMRAAYVDLYRELFPKLRQQRAFPIDNDKRLAAIDRVISGQKELYFYFHKDVANETENH